MGCPFHDINSIISARIHHLEQGGKHDSASGCFRTRPLDAIAQLLALHRRREFHGSAGSHFTEKAFVAKAKAFFLGEMGGI